MIDLDDLVDEWHTTDTGLPFSEFMAQRLGWTTQDVRLWVADPDYRPKETSDG